MAAEQRPEVLDVCERMRHVLRTSGWWDTADVPRPIGYVQDVDCDALDNFAYIARQAVNGVVLTPTGVPGRAPNLSLTSMSYQLSWRPDAERQSWQTVQNRAGPELLLFIDSPCPFIPCVPGLHVREAARTLLDAMRQLELVKDTRRLIANWNGARRETLGGPVWQALPVHVGVRSRVLAITLDFQKVMTFVVGAAST